ncbi:kinetochore Sim4 complex subunit FTA2-domain-containing protein [Triangularia verruculosa]|uniref:Kinetochore Sim4 complex subunit FTA2-domain-containing protein n=1 Tax=Triangularia verruculosa TaxID=2587418 RepID=A0AAN6XCI2_9PEZI|nr:kinetochore Sim4 complex subunit FTA2-domain-containing protein [Triangularia verruculosa]
MITPMASESHLPLPPTAPAVPLPRVPGPKLQPFTLTGHAEIDFLEFVGAGEDRDFKVWKVNIDGRGPYALKMFLFRTWQTLSKTSGKYAEARLAKPEFYVDYLTPFSCECRAYGRLKQDEREDLAVKSHGYLLLTQEQEVEVTLAMGVDDEQLDEPDSLLDEPDSHLNGNNFWCRSEQHRGHPIYAIVKEFIPSGLGHFSQPQVSQLWSEVEELHKLGILVRDLHVRNYMNGKLVDFSRAWTMYHPCLDINPDSLDWLRVEDPQELLEAISSWQENTPLDSPPDIPPDLELCAGWYGGEGEKGADPSQYDWRKWEEDLVAADTFIEQDLYRSADDQEESD